MPRRRRNQGINLKGLRKKWRLSLAHGNVRTKEVDHVLILSGVSVCYYLLFRGKNGSIIAWVLICLALLTLFVVHLF